MSASKIYLIVCGLAVALTGLWFWNTAPNPPAPPQSFTVVSPGGKTTRTTSAEIKQAQHPAPAASIFGRIEITDDTAIAFYGSDLKTLCCIVTDRALLEQAKADEANIETDEPGALATIGWALLGANAKVQQSRPFAVIFQDGVPVGGKGCTRRNCGMDRMNRPLKRLMAEVQPMLLHDKVFDDHAAYAQQFSNLTTDPDQFFANRYVKFKQKAPFPEEVSLRLPTVIVREEMDVADPTTPLGRELARQRGWILDLVAQSGPHEVAQRVGLLGPGSPFPVADATGRTVVIDGDWIGFGGYRAYHPIYRISGVAGLKQLIEGADLSPLATPLSVNPEFDLAAAAFLTERFGENELGYTIKVAGFNPKSSIYRSERFRYPLRWYEVLPE